jgi:hypothetical protein
VTRRHPVSKVGGIEITSDYLRGHARVEVAHRDRDLVGLGVGPARGRKVGKDEGRHGLSLVLTAVIAADLAFAAYGVLYAAMPKSGEQIEEFR